MEYDKIATILLGLLSTLVLFYIHKLNRRQSYLESTLNRNQSESLAELSRKHAEVIAALNHNYSKEAHAANLLYTKRAEQLETASKIVGELEFWAEKCVVPRTRTEFGTKQEIASKMSKAFEDLTYLYMQHPATFKKIDNFYSHVGKLMANVNFIENMVHTNDFSASSEAWNSAVLSFQKELSPLTAVLQSEIEKIMNKT